MNTPVRSILQGAQRNISEAIMATAAARNGNAREEGYDVDRIDSDKQDLTKLMGRLRAIRQELEDLEFTEYL